MKIVCFMTKTVEKKLLNWVVIAIASVNVGVQCDTGLTLLTLRAAIACNSGQNIGVK